MAISFDVLTKRTLSSKDYSKFAHFCIQNHPLPVPEQAPLGAPRVRGKPGSRLAAGRNCTPGSPSTLSCKRIVVILVTLAVKFDISL